MPPERMGIVLTPSVIESSPLALRVQLGNQCSVQTDAQRRPSLVMDGWQLEDDHDADVWPGSDCAPRKVPMKQHTAITCSLETLLEPNVHLHARMAEPVVGHASLSQHSHVCRICFSQPAGARRQLSTNWWA